MNIPIGLLELFTKEELKEYYGDNWREPGPKPTAKTNAAQVNLISKNKAVLKRPLVQPNRWERSPVKVSVKPSTSAFPRKKLFGVPIKSDAVNCKPNEKKTQTHKRKSGSLLSMSEVENKKHFKFQNSAEATQSGEFKITDDSPKNLDVVENRLSVEEKEFIYMEKNLHISNTGKSKSDLRNKIENILLNDRAEFINLKTKFDEFAEKHEENMTSVKNILNQLCDYDTPQMSTKKKVAFVDNRPTHVDIPGDRGLEKAVNMYNTFRENYNIPLGTPHLSRNGLQTPKSFKKQNDLSRKLQKQCLLLMDTPSK